MVRAFLAIDLPLELKKELFKLSKIDLPEGIKVKWVEEPNFHITLKFFGNVQEKMLEKLYNETQKLAKDISSFQLLVDKVGFFSGKRTPRVVWIGIKTQENTLFELQKKLKKLFKKFGFDEEKTFHPHITLFRIKTLRNFQEFEFYFKKISQEADFIKDFTFKVKELTFFKSILTPQGPIYQPLYKVELKK